MTIRPIRPVIHETRQQKGARSLLPRHQVWENDQARPPYFTG